MEANLNDTTVVHNEVAQRFEMAIEGLRALLTYRRFPDRIVLVHTEVPAPFEGRGLAAKLVRTALDFARVNHLRVVPACPYVATFLRKHPEYQDLVSPDDLQRILALPTSAPAE